MRYLVILLVATFAGCTHVRHPLIVDYRLTKPLTIHLCNQPGIEEQAALFGLPAYVAGYTDCNGTIWVRRDPFDPMLPDFAALGHEVWHQEQLGGRYHK